MAKLNGKWLVAATLMMPSLALAHPGHGGGLEAGLIHPLTGWDHLLAMLAVGMLAARMGGRALWALPLAFVSALAMGAVLGVAELTWGPVEAMVALSVIGLGVWLASGHDLPLQLGAAAVALFGLYHGMAHGGEVTGSPAAFMAGMVSMSALLHVSGALAVRKAQTLWARRALRLAGVGMALAGGMLLVN